MFLKFGCFDLLYYIHIGCCQMTTVDKSCEPDATAALVKLMQKEQVSSNGNKISIYNSRWSEIFFYHFLSLTPDEQETERKARKQFKGLFDKKPGDIAEVGVDNREDRMLSENQKNDKEDSDGDKEFHEAEDAPPRMGFLSYLWPTGRRFFTALGLNRCSIL